MTDSVTTIFNRALNACGARDDVADPDETSREAEVCRNWYDAVRGVILRAAHWPCAKSYARLAVLAERDTDADWVSTDPAPGFIFAYSLPNDCLTPRFLSDYTRFEAGVHANVPALYSNTEEAVLVYTKDQTNVALWDMGLRMAIVYGLAAHICMPLSAKPTRARGLAQQANELINEARAMAANEHQTFLDTVPDWIAARGYAGSAPNTRFFYPYGPMISTTEVVGVR